MKITIKQAQEDSYGNAKENIFLAFNEQDQYLGNGFVFPTMNYHQTNETPFLLFMDVDVQEQPGEDEIRKILFDAVIKRANELREEKKEVKCRIYSGFEWNQKKMDFYIQNGFEEDYSIVMEANLTNGQVSCLPSNIEATEFNIETSEKFADYKKIYDEYFVTPLDEGFVEAQKEDLSFKNYYFYLDKELVGEFSLRVEDNCGWIETLFVLDNHRGKGIAKLMMEYIHQHFQKQGLEKARLEVWELNKRAVNLYKVCGYTEIQKKDMFPGITV